MGRAPCCEKVGLKRGPWTSAEDFRLIQYIETHGEGGWRALPKEAGLLRCGKSCRLRWCNYLRPDLKRGNISEDEERLIIKLHSLLGNRWSLIAGRLPGRTDNEIKNHWNAHLKKRLRAVGIDPETHQPLHHYHHHHYHQLKGAPQVMRKGKEILQKSTTAPTSRASGSMIGMRSKPPMQICAYEILSGWERTTSESKPGLIPGLPARVPSVERWKVPEHGPSSSPAGIGAYHGMTISHHYGSKEAPKARHQVVPAAVNQICVSSNPSSDKPSNSIANSKDATLAGDQVPPATISSSQLHELISPRAPSIEDSAKATVEVDPLLSLQTGDDNDQLEPENTNLWSLLEYSSESLWETGIIHPQEGELAIGSPVSVDAGAWADLWGMEGMVVGPSWPN